MNTVRSAGRSIAKVARRARGQAEEASDGLGARPRVALQQRPRTHPATPRTADAAAIDTRANSNNPSHGQHISLHLTVPPIASTLRLPYIPYAATATAGQSDEVYLARPVNREWVTFCGT